MGKPNEQENPEPLKDPGPPLQQRDDEEKTDPPPIDPGPPNP